MPHIDRIPLVAEPLIDASEVATALGISRRTVESQRFQERFGIRAITLGKRMTKFHPAEVRRALARAAGETVDQ